MGTQAWLQCVSVDRGMFSDELAVVVTRSNGDEAAFFVPADMVDQEACRVRVGVRVDGPITWATLPTPDRETISVTASAVTV